MIFSLFYGKLLIFNQDKRCEYDRKQAVLEGIEKDQDLHDDLESVKAFYEKLPGEFWQLLHATNKKKRPGFYFL